MRLFVVIVPGFGEHDRGHQEEPRSKLTLHHSTVPFGTAAPDNAAELTRPLLAPWRLKASHFLTSQPHHHCPWATPAQVPAFLQRAPGPSASPLSHRLLPSFHPLLPQCFCPSWYSTHAAPVLRRQRLDGAAWLVSSWSASSVTAVKGVGHQTPPPAEVVPVGSAAGQLPPGPGRCTLLPKQPPAASALQDPDMPEEVCPLPVANASFKGPFVLVLLKQKLPTHSK